MMIHRSFPRCDDHHATIIVSCCLWRPSLLLLLAVCCCALRQGWEARQDRTGRLYFVDHVRKATSWEDPRPLPPGACSAAAPAAPAFVICAAVMFDGSFLSRSVVCAAPAASVHAFSLSGAGWECKADEKLKRKYYVDHNTKSTTWTDPRPPIVLPIPRPALSPGAQVPDAAAAATASSSAEGHPNTGAGGIGGETSRIRTTYDGSHKQDLDWYRDVLQMSLVDKSLTPDEDALLASVRTKLKITAEDHRRILAEWSDHRDARDQSTERADHVDISGAACCRSALPRRRRFVQQRCSLFLAVVLCAVQRLVRRRVRRDSQRGSLA